MKSLPTPDLRAAPQWTQDHLADLFRDNCTPSTRFRGGQVAADNALTHFDVSGYAQRRNEVWPVDRQGASGLSPWIRHGLLTLQRVWAHSAGGPARDVGKFRDELLWQEYARHVYARLGDANAQPLRGQPHTTAHNADPPWDRGMRCMALCMDELEADGWLVNQTRMWLASQWSVRHGADWQAGERAMYRHLLDGSNAANRLGWQWTIGAGTRKRYGFSRWQVNKRAPGLCDGCAFSHRCPIEHWPATDQTSPAIEHPDPRIKRDPDLATTAGPDTPQISGSPDGVWITIESMGDADPALAAHPDLPAVFVFDEPLLREWDWSAKRLIFVVESLADLARRRPVEILRGDVVDGLRNRRLAATFTPVPEWRRAADQLDLAAIYPWPWLRSPHARSLQSFSAWRKALQD